MQTPDFSPQPPPVEKNASLPYPGISSMLQLGETQVRALSGAYKCI